MAAISKWVLQGRIGWDGEKYFRVTMLKSENQTSKQLYTKDARFSMT